MDKAPPPHNGMYPSYAAPISRHRERRRAPIFTVLAVLACIAVFVVVMYRNNCPANIAPGRSCILGSSFKRMSFQPWSENPLLGPTSLTLQSMGGLRRDLVVDRKEGWRLMSCVWLHAGVFHLVVNMIALLVFGIQLEREFGFVKVGVLYLIAGLGGSLLSSLMSENANAISVGASGALFGLLGASASELITNWSRNSNGCGLLVELILVAALNLAIGLLPRVDNWAHIGGFVTGFLLGFVILIQPQRGFVRRRDLLDPNMERPVKHRFKAYQWILFVVSILLLIAGFVGGFIALYNHENVHSKCSWCHYLDCIPWKGHWTCDANSA